jgi:hypothetical protein
VVGMEDSCRRPEGIMIIMMRRWSRVRYMKTKGRRGRRRGRRGRRRGSGKEYEEMLCVGQVIQAITLRHTVFDAWYIALQHHFYGACTLNNVEFTLVELRKVEMSG